MWYILASVSFFIILAIILALYKNKRKNKEEPLVSDEIYPLW